MARQHVFFLRRAGRDADASAMRPYLKTSKSRPEVPRGSRAPKNSRLRGKSTQNGPFLTIFDIFCRFGLFLSILGREWLKKSASGGMGEIVNCQGLTPRGILCGGAGGRENRKWWGEIPKIYGKY